VITILGVQSAGFAHFYGTGNRKKGKMAYFVEIYKKTDGIKIIFEKSVQRHGVLIDRIREKLYTIIRF